MQPVCRTVWLFAWLTAFSAVAGCGGGPQPPALARTDAVPLISLAHKIAAEQPCAQARDIRLLQQQAVRLVNERRVPAELQETMLSGVGALTADTPPCLPPVKPAPPPPPPKPSHKKHGHGHGKGKH